MEIEFQGRYDKASLFKAVFLANKPSKRNTIIRIAAAIVCMVVYVAYFTVVAGKETVSSFDLLRVGRHLITLLVVGYFLFQPYISSYITASKLWKDPTMQQPVAGAVSSQGVAYFSSPKERREIAWESFAKKQTTANIIVLLTAEGTLSFFPRHFFKTDDDWQKVNQWVDFKVVEAV